MDKVINWIINHPQEIYQSVKLAYTIWQRLRIRRRRKKKSQEEKPPDSSSI